MWTKMDTELFNVRNRSCAGIFNKERGYNSDIFAYEVPFVLLTTVLKTGERANIKSLHQSQ